ncbi:hypothetical protein pdam_00004346 [Pocillopora damicornis]|uniref:Uncharacterized protein n=1 Tax=Pocillopora damicornis TaxID=46731 RepID=A0A3M6UIV0_POCDA|nr:hypothetical protein pdam_00004346 [Pocillopora damicornis]
MIELQMKGDCGVCGRYSGSIYVTFKVLKFHLRTTDKSLYFSTTQCNDLRAWTQLRMSKAEFSAEESKTVLSMSVPLSVNVFLRITL